MYETSVMPEALLNMLDARRISRAVDRVRWFSADCVARIIRFGQEVPRSQQRPYIA
jgi:hypothetical protein